MGHAGYAQLKTAERLTAGRAVTAGRSRCHLAVLVSAVRRHPGHQGDAPRRDDGEDREMPQRGLPGPGNTRGTPLTGGAQLWADTRGRHVSQVNEGVWSVLRHTLRLPTAKMRASPASRRHDVLTGGSATVCLVSLRRSREIRARMEPTLATDWR